MARGYRRDARRAVVAGVAAGIARATDVDPLLVRFVFVVLTLFHGLGALVYLVAWAVMPSAAGEPADYGDPVAEPLEWRAGERLRPALGWALILGGTLLLLHNLDIIRWPGWATLGTLWPLVLVAMGAGLMLRSGRHATTP